MPFPLEPSVGRRTAIKKISAGLLLAAGRWPGAILAREARPPDGEFRFVVVNDTHYMSPECGEWLARAVQRMRAEQPEFILHAGDLVERGYREHLLAVRDLFDTANVPCYYQSGNHDHLLDGNRAAYEELFPDRVNYTFEHSGWQFVGVDTCKGALASNILISESTIRWLKTALKRIDRARPLVLFTHFPLAEAVRYRPRNAEDLLSLLLPFNLQGVFSGHYHASTERSFSGTFVVTNRCCALKRTNHDGSPEKGFVVCVAKAGRISRRFVEVT